MTRPQIARDLPETALYAALAELHGHYCPMSTLGLRLGWAARPLLGDADSFLYQARTCAVDGIRLALDIPDLPVRNDGLHRLLANIDESVQIGLTPRALELAAGYRHLDDEEQSRLLEQLRLAPVDELVEITVNGASR